MKVTVRKGAPSEANPEGMVVAEIWMTVQDAKALGYKTPALDDALDAAVVEHLRTRYRVSKQVRTGRHP